MINQDSRELCGYIMDEVIYADGIIRFASPIEVSFNLLNDKNELEYFTTTATSLEYMSVDSEVHVITKETYRYPVWVIDLADHSIVAIANAIKEILASHA